MRRVWNSAKRYLRIVVQQLTALARQVFRMPGSGHRCDHRRSNRERDCLRGNLDNCWPAQPARSSSGQTHKHIANPKCELESSLNTVGASLLSDNQRISRASGGIRWSKGSPQTETNARRGCESISASARTGAGIIEMPTKSLSPNHYIAPQYNSPKENTSVSITVESDIPVKTYIVRPKALDLFKEGSESFKYYGGFPDARMHQRQTLLLPFSGPWHLIISNPDDEAQAEVEYEVSY